MSVDRPRRFHEYLLMVGAHRTICTKVASNPADLVIRPTPERLATGERWSICSAVIAATSPRVPKVTRGERAVLCAVLRVVGCVRSVTIGRAGALTSCQCVATLLS